MVRNRGQNYWQAVIETFYDGLEGLDTSAYAWAPSDRWTQSRTADQWSSHLEAWVDIGNAIRMDSSSYYNNCRLMFSARYQSSDDSIAQARIQAATRAACEFLMGVVTSDGGRVVAITGVTLEGPYNGEWVVPTISFTLRLPR